MAASDMPADVTTPTPPYHPSTNRQVLHTVQELYRRSTSDDFLFIFSPTRRCLHDLVAGTQVVKVD